MSGGPSWRGAAWAGLLSLFVPGLGQVYAQRYRAALGFAAASIAIATGFVVLLKTTGPLLTGWVLAAFMGLALATFALNTAAAAHAVTLAKSAKSAKLANLAERQVEVSRS